MNAWLVWVALCVTPNDCRERVAEYRYYATERECFNASFDWGEKLRAKYPAIRDKIVTSCRLAPR